MWVPSPSSVTPGTGWISAWSLWRECFVSCGSLLITVSLQIELIFNVHNSFCFCLWSDILIFIPSFQIKQNVKILMKTHLNATLFVIDILKIEDIGFMYWQVPWGINTELIKYCNTQRRWMLSISLDLINTWLIKKLVRLVFTPSHQLDLNQNQKGIYSPWKFEQTRNLLWQEGAYNKHIGILNLDIWSNYTKDT